MINGLDAVFPCGAARSTHAWIDHVTKSMLSMICAALLSTSTNSSGTTVQLTRNSYPETQAPDVAKANSYTKIWADKFDNPNSLLKAIRQAGISQAQFLPRLVTDQRLLQRPAMAGAEHSLFSGID